MGEFSSQYWTPGSIPFSKYFKSPTNVNIVKKTVKNQSYTKYTLYLLTERLIVSSVLRLSVLGKSEQSAPSETNWKLLHGRVLISLGIYLCSDKILYREKNYFWNNSKTKFHIYIEFDIIIVELFWSATNFEDKPHNIIIMRELLGSVLNLSQNFYLVSNCIDFNAFKKYSLL